MKPKELDWTDPAPAGLEIPYDHVTAQTPFGRVLITWKSWKDYPDYAVEETTWGDYFGSASSLEAAKAIAEAEYHKRLMECIAV